MKTFTIFTANTTGNSKNCIYQNEVKVADISSLEKIMRRDHVCAKYRNDRRGNDNFQYSDCIPMDCDNDHGSAI